eukprot:TRINITY_DN14997_c0_g1_i1.p1 TRINITY_DN14997_c0_g1~~TRINITY_DN14997_c0_g1_i1.p1  ORF type:complete len:127 (+),score=17.57 TRINITY_DN14997_c0_g1_i1:248-628(+)
MHGHICLSARPSVFLIFGAGGLPARVNLHGWHMHRILGAAPRDHPYFRALHHTSVSHSIVLTPAILVRSGLELQHPNDSACLLYTSDAADEEDSVDLGGRRIIKKKKKDKAEKDDVVKREGRRREE